MPVPSTTQDKRTMPIHTTQSTSASPIPSRSQPPLYDLTDQPEDKTVKNNQDRIENCRSSPPPLLSCPPPRQVAHQPAANAYDGCSRHITTATLPLPLIDRAQSAIAWGWAGELWRLQTSGRAHRATRRGPAANPPQPPPAAPPLLLPLSLGKKVSAVEGLAQTGVRPDTMSRRKAACPGCSEAKETVVDASTYICTEDDTAVVTTNEHTHAIFN